MAQPENSADDGTREERRPAETTGDPATDDDTAGWFAASTFRVGLAIVGLILLLFALGQAVGVDLLGMFVDALTTRTGRWLTVAFFALILIALAARGFRGRFE